MQPSENKEMKVFDLDAAFDKRVAEYFAKKKNKYTEEEWEDLVPELYKQFANTRIESLGATPNEYYSRMTEEELSSALCVRLKKGVPVDGFLRAALEEEKNRPVLISLLDGDNEEAAFAVELLGADKRVYEEYFSLLRRANAESLQEKIADILKEDADEFCDELLELYGEGFARDYVADILSYCLCPRDEVFSVLLNEFLATEKGLEAATMRLSRYGDEQALPYIKERAESQGTGYLDWRALRLAAEALGGSVAERDFSKDEEYLTMQREEAKQQEEREEEYSKERNAR